MGINSPENKVEQLTDDYLNRLTTIEKRLAGLLTSGFELLDDVRFANRGSIILEWARNPQPLLSDEYIQQATADEYDTLEV